MCAAAPRLRRSWRCSHRRFSSRFATKKPILELAASCRARQTICILRSPRLAICPAHVRVRVVRLGSPGGRHMEAATTRIDAIRHPPLSDRARQSRFDISTQTIRFSQRLAHARIEGAAAFAYPSRVRVIERRTLPEDSDDALPTACSFTVARENPASRGVRLIERSRRVM